MRRPAIAVDLLSSGDLTRSYAMEDWALRFHNHFLSPKGPTLPAEMNPAREPWTETDFQKQLRLFRYREMMRIAIRDLPAPAVANSGCPST